MKIAVMGTGGVGGYFGGLLARAGNDVTFVARGAHLQAIRERGLRVESANDGIFTVSGPAVEDTAEAGEQELVLFTVKMYHNEAAIAATRQMLGPDSLVLTLQNGIDTANSWWTPLARNECLSAPATWRAALANRAWSPRAAPAWHPLASWSRASPNGASDCWPSFRKQTGA